MTTELPFLREPGTEDPQPGEDVLRDLVASDGDPRDLLETAVGQVRTFLEHRFYAFLRYLSSWDGIDPTFHGPICELYERWGEPGWERLMVQMPRESGKTTILSVYGTLWSLVRDPDRTFGVFNATEFGARRILRSIAEIMERSLLFQVLWSDLLPPGVAKHDRRSMPRNWPWSGDRLLLNRPAVGIAEVSVTAFGVGASVAGHHFTHLVKDDLIGESARDSPTMMQSVKEWFDTSLFLGKNIEALRDLVVCTRWHYDDVYEYARRRYSYTLYRRRALEQGETVCSRLWSTDYLLKYQQSHPTVFACMMQNEPVAGEDLSFQAEWLREAKRVGEPGADDEAVTIPDPHFDPKITVLEEEAPRTVPLHWMTKTLLVDPSPTEQRDRKQQPNARTALVMKGHDPWGRRFWLDLWAGNEDPIALCRRMIRMCLDWGTDRFAVEEVVFSKVYAPVVRYVAQREFGGVFLHYVPLRPGRRDKDTRIAGKASSFAGGFEYVLPECRALLAEEYLTFPYSPTRDLLDAGAYDEDPGVLPRPESPDEWEERAFLEHQSRTGEDGRDPWTGY